MLSRVKRKQAPGKLMAVEKWILPSTLSALRRFLGFANYYAADVKGYAGLADPVLDKLRFGKFEGKKGSTVKVKWYPESEKAFVDVTAALLAELFLFTAL